MMKRKVAFAGFDLLDTALESLLEEGCEVLKIFTCRVDEEFESNAHVIRIAEQLHIPWSLEPVSLEDLKYLKECGCELFVSAGYYHKLPVLDGLTMVNIHPSLLPEGRGAWPMPVMILNGMPDGGVTIHRIREHFDEGEILLQESFPIDVNDTLEDVTQKIRNKIPAMIAALCNNLEELYAKAARQTGGSYWKCPKEEDFPIHCEMTVKEADRILRAFYGYGCIYEDQGKRCQLVRGRAVSTETAEKENPDLLKEQYKTAFPLKDGWITAEATKKLDYLTEITLDQKDKIDGLRQEFSHTASSHAFASLYIWKHAMKLSLYITDRMFAVKTEIRGKNTWFFPCGDPEQKKEFLASHIKEPDFCLCYAREEDVAFVQEHFPEVFVFEKKDGDGEYLYKREEFVRLRGKKFAKLRNQRNRALCDHTLECILLEDSTLPQAREVIKTWQKTHEESGEFGIKDEDASLLLLEHWKEFDLHGILLIVDGEIFAIAAGFKLSSNFFDFCIAKQKESLPGIPFYIKWALANSLSEEIDYINAEEDMEIEGLRMMKQYMQPCGMISMYTGTIG